MAAPARQRSLVVPREHGAWGLLLVPLAAGAGVGLLAGGRGSGLAPLAMLAVALFWLRTPVESWAGTAAVRANSAGEKRLVRRAALGLAAIAAAAGLWLFWGGRNGKLVWIGGIAAAAFLAQGVVKRLAPGARGAAQTIGAAGLTATAPAAYYAATGALIGTAWALWAANFLFAANQIHFVQLRIRAAHLKSRREIARTGWGFLAGQAVLMALLPLFGGRAAAAFLPILLRGFAFFAAKPGRLRIHRLGKTELAYGCLFGVLLIAGMG